MKLLNTEAARLSEEVNRLQKENSETTSRVETLRKEDDSIKAQINAIIQKEEKAAKLSADLKKRDADLVLIKKERNSEYEKVVAAKKKSGCC